MFERCMNTESLANLRLLFNTIAFWDLVNVLQFEGKAGIIRVLDLETNLGIHFFENVASNH
jgi:hypothetical protein